jgi:hypothetical protein
MGAAEVTEPRQGQRFKFSWVDRREEEKCLEVFLKGTTTKNQRLRTG